METRKLALIAGLLSAVGVQLGTATHGWHEVLTPGFVAGFCINVATVIYALMQEPPGGTTGGGGGTTMRGTIVGLLGAVLVGLTLSACASAGVGRSNQIIYDATEAAVTASEQAHTQHAITDVQFKAVNAALHVVAVAGRDLTKIERAGQAKPADYARFLSAVEDATQDARAAVPDQSTIAGVLTQLLKIEKLAQSLSGQ